MEDNDKEEFKFPDEVEAEPKVEIKIEEEGVEVEVQDDTPEEDRGVEPLSKEVVDELEKADESEDYSKNVKTKFKQYKKAWHDERRVKEAALKEHQEALALAQKVLNENKRLKSMIQDGEKELINTYQNSAQLELEKAKDDYKKAYDTGDSDKILEAQQQIVNASLKIDKAKNYRPKVENTLQEDENAVQIQYQQNKPVQMDQKVAAWVSSNPWYTDPEKVDMAQFAQGYHHKLRNTYGDSFVGTDEYFKRIDKEVRRRFPEEFDVEETQNEDKPQHKSKPSTVVAPAKRSTSSKKIVLKTSQIALAKKLGLTPEQYADAQLKLEL